MGNDSDPGDPHEESGQAAATAKGPYHCGGKWTPAHDRALSELIRREEKAAGGKGKITSTAIAQRAMLRLVPKAAGNRSYQAMIVRVAAMRKAGKEAGGTKQGRRGKKPKKLPINAWTDSQARALEEFVSREEIAGGGPTSNRVQLARRALTQLVPMGIGLRSEGAVLKRIHYIRQSRGALPTPAGSASNNSSPATASTSQATVVGEESEPSGSAPTPEMACQPTTGLSTAASTPTTTAGDEPDECRGDTAGGGGIGSAHHTGPAVKRERRDFTLPVGGGRDEEMSSEISSEWYGSESESSESEGDEEEGEKRQPPLSHPPVRVKREAREEIGGSGQAEVGSAKCLNVVEPPQFTFSLFRVSPSSHRPAGTDLSSLPPPLQSHRARAIHTPPRIRIGATRWWMMRKRRRRIATRRVSTERLPFPGPLHRYWPSTRWLAVRWQQ